MGNSTQTGESRVYVSGNSTTIGLFRLDPQTGSLTKAASAAAGQNPSYLALAPGGQYLYAVNEIAESRVLAFRVDPSTGGLTEINRANTGGDGATHLAVHPSGKWVAVAHYNSGHTVVLPVLDNGGVGDPIASSRGPDDSCKNAHQALFDDSGAHLFVPCLGSNYVLQLKLVDGRLEYNDPPTVAVAGGPRHMALHPSQRTAYVLSELESILTSFDYDPRTGRLSNPVSIPSVQQRQGASAHVAVHPGGKFLYVSNRAENSVGLFALDAKGRASPVDFVTEGISTPRDFVLAPNGELLLAANQAGAQDVLVFRIAPADGRLTRLSSTKVGGDPTFVGVASPR